MLEVVPGQVNIWRVRVDRDWESTRPFLKWLDRSEQQRAERYHFKRDAISFILTRAYLRSVLGAALGVDPAAVIFVYGPAGKPLLPNGESLWFSASHSGAYAVLALARDRVGIDIERARPVPVHDLSQYLSHAEALRLLALPESERLSAFFRCWTRKEAYLKARGDGVGFGLSRFTVTVGLDEPPRLIWVDEEPDEPARWQLRDFLIHAEYSGSLAVENRLSRIICWDIEADRVATLRPKNSQEDQVHSVSQAPE